MYKSSARPQGMCVSTNPKELLALSDRRNSIPKLWRAAQGTLGEDMKGEHKAQLSLKHQNREENGPSEAPVRVGRKMEEKKGDLVESNSRAALSSAPSASQCSPHPEPI